MASSSPLLLSLFIFFSVFVSSSAQKQPKGLFINCGAEASFVENSGLKWIPDTQFVHTGISLKIPNSSFKTLEYPLFSTLRYFPDANSRKSCFEFPVVKSARYLVRTAYFYGDFDGRGSPPVFDQIVDGTYWGVVNTTADFASGKPSYYEIFLAAGGKKMSVCVARNEDTKSGSPYISGIQLVMLANSVYNLTDLGIFTLKTVARSAFGSDGDTIRFPDDPFDRFWQPFIDSQPFGNVSGDVNVSGFWNLPPAKVFKTALTTTHDVNVREIHWPVESLGNASYYIALYFNHDPVPGSPDWRAFSIHVNNVLFYPKLNVTSGGVAVFAKQWPLFNSTTLTLRQSPGSTVGPIINAGELLEMMKLGNRTLSKDIVALESLRNSIRNPPPDWYGDPCLPSGNSWTGIKCYEGSRVRVTGLNLTGMGMIGSLPSSIARMTALEDVWLGYNNFSGHIPDLSPLQRLNRLHLENNDFSRSIPATLGNISSLHELYLQNNNFTGKIPDSLKNKPGLIIQTSPGNHLDS